MFRHIINYLCGYYQDSDRNNIRLKPHLPYGPLMMFCFVVTMAAFTADLNVLMNYRITFLPFNMGALFLVLFSVGSIMLVGCSIVIYIKLDSVHNGRYLYYTENAEYEKLHTEEALKAAENVTEELHIKHSFDR